LDSSLFEITNSALGYFQNFSDLGLCELGLMKYHVENHFFPPTKRGRKISHVVPKKGVNVGMGGALGWQGYRGFFA